MAVTVQRRFNPPSLRRALKLVRRNTIVYKHTWSVIFTGFFEPLFYLLAVGFGVGQAIETLPFKGVEIPYAAFIAPGMLAASCLNGAITDGFFNPFFKLHFAKTYDGILATPLGVPDVALGEMMWAQIRGSIYSVCFLIVMAGFGLIYSPWAILALPAAMLAAGAFSAGAMVITSIVKELTAFDKVMNLIVFPLFLFSGTFFPVEIYPQVLQPIVKATPLYHGAALLRSLTTGIITSEVIFNVLYLVTMFFVAISIAMYRLDKRLIV